MIVTQEKQSAVATRPSVVQIVAFVIAFELCAIVILAYVWLIPLGHWQDEFFSLKVIHDGGLVYEYHRIMDWSPRPFSEPLVYLYSHAVMLARKPLIGTVLYMTWGLVTAALVAVPAILRRRMAPSALLAAALGALFLIGHQTGEMFYWPMAALAYLPALAALCAAFWLTFDGLQTTRQRVTAAALLSVAACSIEICAMLVCVFALMGIVSAALARDRMVWLIVPLAVSIGVMLLMYNGRVTHAAQFEMIGDPAIAHHFWVALRSSMKGFMLESVSVDGLSFDHGSIGRGALGKVAFGVASFGLAREIGSRYALAGARWLAVLAIACLATSFLTVAAGMYQFGLVCCERHATFRQCLVYLGIASAAAAVAFGSLRRFPGNLPPLAYIGALVLAICLPLPRSVPKLATDYSNYSEMQNAKVRTWNSGMAPGDSMVYHQYLPGQVVGGIYAPDKTYSADDPNVVWWLKGIPTFFGKKTVTVVTGH
jgi:hypothetical protein